jgi:hypothetical protein
VLMGPGVHLAAETARADDEEFLHVQERRATRSRAVRHARTWAPVRVRP